MLLKDKQAFYEWAYGKGMLRNQLGEAVEPGILTFPLYVEGPFTSGISLNGLNMNQYYFMLTGDELRKLAIDVFGVMGEQYQR